MKSSRFAKALNASFSQRGSFPRHIVMATNSLDASQQNWEVALTEQTKKMALPFLPGNGFNKNVSMIRYSRVCL